MKQQQPANSNAMWWLGGGAIVLGVGAVIWYEKSKTPATATVSPAAPATTVSTVGPIVTSPTVSAMTPASASSLPLGVTLPSLPGETTGLTFTGQ